MNSVGTAAIYEFIDHIDTKLNRLYEEHADQFTYVMETPYSYHYWCEQYQPALYKQREVLIDCLVKLRNIE